MRGCGIISLHKARTHTIHSSPLLPVSASLRKVSYKTLILSCYIKGLSTIFPKDLRTKLNTTPTEPKARSRNSQEKQPQPTSTMEGVPFHPGFHNHPAPIRVVPVHAAPAHIYAAPFNRTRWLRLPPRPQYQTLGGPRAPTATLNHPPQCMS